MLEKPILVAYATRTGTAKEVAEVLKDQLQRKGAKAELWRIEDVQDLDPYRAVILGSAIRDEAWLPEALEFVKKHQAELQQIAVFYYLVSMTLHDNTPEHAQEALDYLRPVRDLVEPVDIGLFGGKLDDTSLAPLTRQKLSRKSFPKGDWRDWKAIRAWGERVFELANQEQVARGI